MARTCLSHPKPSGALDIDVASRLAPLPLVLLLPDLAHLSRSDLGLLGVSKGGRSNPHSDDSEPAHQRIQNKDHLRIQGLHYDASFIIHHTPTSWGVGWGIIIHQHLGRMHAYMHVCTYACKHVRMYACLHAWMCVCMYVDVCRCMMYIWIYMWMYSICGCICGCM